MKTQCEGGKVTRDPAPYNYLAPNGFACSVRLSGKMYEMKYTEWFDISHKKWRDLKENLTELMNTDSVLQVSMKSWYSTTLRRGYTSFRYTSTKGECLAVMFSELSFQMAAENVTIARDRFNEVMKLYKNGQIRKVIK